MHHVTTPTTNTPDGDRLTYGSRLTICSAVVAAAAAMSLAACGPHDEGAASPSSVGATPAAPSTATVVARPSQPVPPAPMAMPAQSVPVPTESIGRAPATNYARGPAASVAPDDGYDPRPSTAYAQPSQYVPAARPQRVQQQRAVVADNRMGSIESIQPLHSRPQGSGAGAVIGGVLGGVLGNRFGSGTGRAAMTGIGAVGGAIAGNNVERNYKESIVGYRVQVRLDNGSTRTFQRSQIGSLHVGDRVRVDSSSSLHRV